MIRLAGIATSAAALLLMGLSHAAAQHRQPPEPRSIAGKCNKEVGGYYNWMSKQWVIKSHLIAAKNACVTRMQGQRR